MADTTEQTVGKRLLVRLAAGAALSMPAMVLGGAIPAQAAEDPGLGDIVSAAEDYVAAEEAYVGELLGAIGGTLT